jgi:hypothetical protein
MSNFITVDFSEGVSTYEVQLTAAPPVPRKRRKAVMEIEAIQKDPDHIHSNSTRMCNMRLYNLSSYVLEYYRGYFENVPSVPRKRRKAVMEIETIQKTRPHP